MSKSLTLQTALLTALLTAMAAVAPSVALAGPYLGIGVGGGRMESSLAELDLVPTLPGDTDAIGTDPDFSSSDVNFDITAGWAFTKNLSVEVGFTDFGEATQDYELPEVCGAFGCQSREWTTKVDMSGLRAFIVGTLPLDENFDVYAKLGAIYWDADYSGYERNQLLVPDDFPIGERNDPVAFDDDGTDIAAGLGLNMKTDTPFSLRLDFSYYDIDSTDLLFTVSLLGVYTFDW